MNNSMNTMPLDPQALHDLYHALKKITTWWNAWMPNESMNESGMEALQQGLDAIDKAEGRVV